MRTVGFIRPFWFTVFGRSATIADVMIDSDTVGAIRDGAGKLQWSVMMRYTNNKISNTSKNRCKRIRYEWDAFPRFCGLLERGVMFKHIVKIVGFTCFGRDWVWQCDIGRWNLSCCNSGTYHFPVYYHGEAKNWNFVLTYSFVLHDLSKHSPQVRYIWETYGTCQRFHSLWAVFTWDVTVGSNRVF